MGDVEFADRIMDILRQNIALGVCADADTIQNVFTARGIPDQLKRFVVDRCIDAGAENFKRERTSRLPSGYVLLALETALERAYYGGQCRKAAEAACEYHLHQSPAQCYKRKDAQKAKMGRGLLKEVDGKRKVAKNTVKKPELDGDRAEMAVTVGGDATGIRGTPSIGVAKVVEIPTRSGKDTGCGVAERKEARASLAMENTETSAPYKKPIPRGPSLKLMEKRGTYIPPRRIPDSVKSTTQTTVNGVYCQQNATTTTIVSPVSSKADDNEAVAEATSTENGGYDPDDQVQADIPPPTSGQGREFPLSGGSRVVSAAKLDRVVPASDPPGATEVKDLKSPTPVSGFLACLEKSDLMSSGIQQGTMENRLSEAVHAATGDSASVKSMERRRGSSKESQGSRQSDGSAFEVHFYGIPGAYPDSQVGA